MTDRNKFEEMLERLVNEDRAGAEELFHEIVVEKSRDIYETLLSEDDDEVVDEATDEEVDEATDEEVDESDDEDLDEATDEEVDESDDEDLDETTDEEVEEGFFPEADPAMGDPDDMTMDIAMPADDGMGDGDDMGMGDEEPAGDIEDRVMDIEDELEALKAEFEQMLGDEGDDAEDDMGGDDDAEEMPMDMDSDDDDDDAEEESYAFETTGEEVDEATDEEVDESTNANKSETEIMREYTDKISANMGDNGANAKSIVAKANNMGGTSANIAKGGEADSKGTTGGLAAPSAKTMNTKNVNVKGAKGATKMSTQPGHGAEKKGKPENAGDKGSMLNGAPKRAK